MTNITIYGLHSINSYLRTSPQHIVAIYCTAKHHDKRQQELIQLATAHNIKLTIVNKDELDRLSNTTHHQGVAACVIPGQKLTLEQVLQTIEDTQARVLLLDGITDPQNLGSILRTAECFNVAAVILPKHNSANIDNAAVIKAASGAVNHLSIVTVNNLSNAIKLLKQHEFWIAGTSLADSSSNLFEFKFTGRLALIMGNEHNGMRRLVTEHCDYLLNIPQSGITQSLNVAVATGIVLAHTSYLLA